MKHNLLCLLLLVSGSSLFAQHRLEKHLNLPRPEDKIVKQQVEYKSPGRQGADVLWDFSKQELIDDEYKVSYPDYYPDSLIIAREQRTLFKYGVQGDSLLFVGLENPTTLINHLRPELQLIYPVSYGQKYEDYFFGTGDYCGQLDLTVCGKSSYQANAYGRMLLPGGEILEHVLRVHHEKKQVEKAKTHYSFSLRDTVYFTDSIDYRLLTDTITTKTDTYKWYALGYRYPVFETVSTTVYYLNEPVQQFATSFYYPPGEQYYGLEDDPENLAIRERLQEEKERRGNQEGGEGDLPQEGIINYNVFMNQKGSRLMVEYYLSEPAEVSMILFDMQGRMLEQYPKERKEDGYYTYSIQMEGYQRGEYLLRITVNEKTYTEKIVKS